MGAARPAAAAAEKAAAAAAEKAKARVEPVQCTALMVGLPTKVMIRMVSGSNSHSNNNNLGNHNNSNSRSNGSHRPLLSRTAVGTGLVHP